MTPEYYGCESNLDTPAVITMNSCYYMLHLPAETKVIEDRWMATLDLECEDGGDLVEVHITRTTPTTQKGKRFALTTFPNRQAWERSS
jgi:hypothetical protein